MRYTPKVLGTSTYSSHPLNSNADASVPDYHSKAQAFIQGAKARGMEVRAEGGELIAYPAKKQAVRYGAVSSGLGVGS